MGKPSDRIKGVRLITDYGALDWAIQKKNERLDKLERMMTGSVSVSEETDK